MSNIEIKQKRIKDNLLIKDSQITATDQQLSSPVLLLKYYFRAKTVETMTNPN